MTKYKKLNQIDQNAIDSIDASETVQAEGAWFGAWPSFPLRVQCHGRCASTPKRRSPLENHAKQMANLYR